MKLIVRYSWLAILFLLVIHGASIIRKEWKRRSILTHGKIVEVTIEKLNCSQCIMTFQFGITRYEKKIEARDCALFNTGQKIKLKHDEEYPDTFLFANEQKPNLFLLGGLEMVLGVFGFLSSWPSKPRPRNSKFLSQNFRQSLN